MTKHFAVIGAGAGGLCAAKHLLARGIDVTLFEAGSQIGGLWVYENDSGMSSAYRSLHINSEARVSTFVDFPFPEGHSLYPDHREMQRYFISYAQHFDLTRRIRFNSRVLAIEPEGERYRIALEQGAPGTFDGVVVASGHQSVPRHPPQVEGFAGVPACAQLPGAGTVYRQARSGHWAGQQRRGYRRRHVHSDGAHGFVGALPRSHHAAHDVLFPIPASC